MRTDLADPRDLQVAEELAAATARAIAGERDLRYRRHVLHRGRRVAPCRAPHAHPDVETQDVDDLRGSADGIALRVRHSDPAIYAEHRPDGPFAELIYEMLEQFRVEALAPATMPGLRANLNHRFHGWSSDFIALGLLENDLGLLLFTVVHVCRSRILAEPIEERVNDHTEATRAGVYQVLGQRLTELRPAIHDQAAFDAIASDLARDVAGLADSMGSAREAARVAPGVLAMLDIEPDEPSDNEATTAQGQRSIDGVDDYAIFTTEFDRIVEVGEIVAPHARRDARQRLDALVAEHRALGTALNRRIESVLPAPIDHAWESELEQGRLDPRLLSRLAIDGADPRIFRAEIPVDRPHAAVSILVDCSGSMKGVIEPIAVLIDLLVRALDRVDIPTEVLGFTTGAWNGGRARQAWLASGRPAQPGRLNETCEIVFKDASTPWRRARAGIASLLWTPMFREGIDGEALEWAAGRLSGIPADRHLLLFISDGSPMDGASTLANDEGYLDRHLAEVADVIEDRGDIAVLGLGIGHDMSTYVAHSRIVDPERILSSDVVSTLIAFLART